MTEEVRHGFTYHSDVEIPKLRAKDSPWTDAVEGLKPGECVDIPRPSSIGVSAIHWAAQRLGISRSLFVVRANGGQACRVWRLKPDPEQARAERMRGYVRRGFSPEEIEQAEAKAVSDL